MGKQMEWQRPLQKAMQPPCSMLASFTVSQQTVHNDLTPLSTKVAQSQGVGPFSIYFVILRLPLSR